MISYPMLLQKMYNQKWDSVLLPLMAMKVNVMKIVMAVENMELKTVGLYSDHSSQTSNGSEFTLVDLLMGQRSL